MTNVYWRDDEDKKLKELMNKNLGKKSIREIALMAVDILPNRSYSACRHRITRLLDKVGNKQRPNKQANKQTSKEKAGTAGVNKALVNLARDYNDGKITYTEYINAYKSLKELDGRSIKAYDVKAMTFALKHNSSLKSRIFKYIKTKHGGVTIGELSRTFDRSEDTIAKAIIELQEEGAYIDYDRDTHQVIIPTAPSVQIDKVELPPLVRNSLRIGIVSDTHIGHKCQQISLLHSAYEAFDKANVDFIVHAGDVSNGHYSMHKGMIYEMFLTGWEETLEYLIKYYPKCRNGAIKTYMLEFGNHDFSWVKVCGASLVNNLVRARDDIVLVRGVKGLFEFKNVSIRIFHPSTGLAYAKSYHPQKFVTAEVMQLLTQLKINELPNVYVIGHFHSTLYLPEGAIDVLVVPSFQSDSLYFNSKGWGSRVGYVILDINLSDGYVSVTPSFVRLDGMIKDKDW